MDSYHDALQAEVEKADGLLHAYQRQLQEANIDPDFRYIGAQSINAYRPTWVPGTTRKLRSQSSNALETMLRARYFLVANLAAQTRARVFTGEEITEPRDVLSPAYEEFENTYLSEYDRSNLDGQGNPIRLDDQFIQRLRNDAVTDFFGVWQHSATDRRMREKEMQDFASRHPDLPRHWETNIDHLPAFGDAPVKDPKTVSGNPGGRGNLDMMEVKNSLPDGVSIKASGYGKKYR